VEMKIEKYKIAVSVEKEKGVELSAKGPVI
jgi:hypothetical protein